METNEKKAIVKALIAFLESEMNLLKQLSEKNKDTVTYNISERLDTLIYLSSSINKILK